MIHDQWHGMWREGDTSGGGQVEGDTGASLGSSVTRSKKERSICDSEITRTVFVPVKEMPSKSIERCGGACRDEPR